MIGSASSAYARASVAPSLQGKGVRFVGERLRLEVAGAQFSGKLQREIQLQLGENELAQVHPDETRQQPPEHFRAAVANSRPGFGRRHAVRHRLPQFVQVDAAPADHVQIGRLDIGETVFACEFDASAEMIEGGSHPALEVVGVAETADRTGFVPRRTGLVRVFAGQFMLLEAAVDVAQREIDVSPAIVDPRQFDGEAVGGRRFLGLRSTPRALRRNGPSPAASWRLSCAIPPWCGRSRRCPAASSRTSIPLVK